MKSKLTVDKRLELIERILQGESISSVAKEVGISRVIFHRWIKRYKKYGEDGIQPKAGGRPKKSLSLSISSRKTPKKFRTLTPHERLRMVEEVVLEGKSLKEVAKKYKVSRNTLYKWIKRYEESPSKRQAAVEDKIKRVPRYYRQSPKLYEDALLSLVEKHPKYGIRSLVRNLPKIGRKPILRHHGVQNILRRYGLSTYEARRAYSEGQVTPIIRVITEIVGVTSRFFTLPFKTRSRIVRLGGIFALSAFSTIVVLGFVGYLATRFIAIPGEGNIGLLFATLALVMGSIFFLYSLKYYLTLAIVLSFSQQESGIRNQELGIKNEKRRGFLSWILGMGNGFHQSPVTNHQSPTALGLTPNLEHITLKRYPFISVHIPLYNEKNVVERVIAAGTNFQYQGDYEVILCDDSTDETTEIIRKYQESFDPELRTSRGDGYTLTECEVRPGVTLKHLHRTSRSGFKGGALRLALQHTDPRAEFVSVFDADFVPYPDTLELFLKYFKVQNSLSEDYSQSKVAAVQGYQWHVLNKSENWITRGVRSEYAGSYVIERSGAEIYTGLKQISGAVYMIRRDVLEEVGWETSITEDFQLTLKLYEKGYKVVYTPYIQAPAECVSTLKRLIRQRMRWAEGHSNNVKRMFKKLLLSPNLTRTEKLEFMYLSPYYLQAFFFLVGTFSWLISETVFPARLPFWTSLWGWSLVLTNLMSLPLMNSVGLFLEESDERDYMGIASFVALSYILVPFQAYAALKGFLEKEEGPWFRTPKTGRITDIFTRGRFYRLIAGILPGRAAPAVAHLNAKPYREATSSAYTLNPYLSLSTANSRFNSFSIMPKRMRWYGKVALVFVLTVSLFIHSLAFRAEPVEATWYNASWLYRKSITVDFTKVSTGPHTNFPVLINLASDTDLAADAQDDGDDILFTSSDKITKLSHEIESFNGTTGALVAWVKVPSLSSTANTVLYLYYGNAAAANQQDAVNVWNANYAQVLHLKEDPSGTAPQMKDSTSNNNHGTSVGSMTSGDLIAGKIGNALDLDGLDGAGGDHISVADSASLDGTVDEGSWSLWINWGDWGSEQKVIMAIANRYTAPTDGYEWGAQAGTPDGNLFAYPWARDPNYNLNTATNFTNGLWHYISVRYDWTSRTLTLNLDGNDLTNSINNVNTTNWTQQANITAAWLWGGSPQRDTRFILAKIDEIRVSDVSRSLGWILTEFNNQNSPSTFYTVGGEEQVPELIVLLLPLAILIPYFVKYMERRKKMYLGVRG